MSKRTTVISTAIASVLALGAIAASDVAMATKKKEVEKCFGVVKAGKNDCQTSNSSCAGTSTADGQKDAWVFVPSGTCLKLVNGSLEPQ